MPFELPFDLNLVLVATYALYRQFRDDFGKLQSDVQKFREATLLQRRCGHRHVRRFRT